MASSPPSGPGTLHHYFGPLRSGPSTDHEEDSASEDEASRDVSEPEEEAESGAESEAESGAEEAEAEEEEAESEVEECQECEEAEEGEEGDAAPGEDTTEELERWNSTTAVEGCRYRYSHKTYGGVVVVAVRKPTQKNCSFVMLCRCGCGKFAKSEGYAMVCATREKVKADVAAARLPDGSLPEFKGASREVAGTYCQRNGIEGRATKRGNCAQFLRFCACGTCFRLTHNSSMSLAPGCSTAPRCENVIDGVRCKAAQCRGNLCSVCYNIQRSGQCPRCPQGLPVGGLQCLNCDAKDARAAKRQLHEPALLALVEAGARDGREVNAWDAEVNVVYVVHNPQDGQRPRLVLRSGNSWRSACTHRSEGKLCTNIVQRTNDGSTTLCHRHGGGMRCESGVHDADEGVPPYAGYVLSDACRQVPMRGKRVCRTCLIKFDPDNLAVDVIFHKEHVFLDALAQELHKRLWGWLTCGKTNIATHDCAAGESRRRMDLMLAMSRRFLTDVEGDENEHVDRSTSCEHAKLSGHLIDAGLAGLSRSESRRDDVLYAEGLPSDADLTKLEGTDADTEDFAKLRAARKALNDHVVRRNQDREADRNLIRLRVLRVNLDGFTAADGSRVGSMFTSVRVQTKADVFKYKLSAEGKRAIPLVVDRILEIYMLQLDDAFVESHKTLEVEYFRYSGCDRDGVDRQGLAVVEIAARENGERAKRVAEDAARREAFKAHAKAKKQKQTATSAGAGPSGVHGNQ